MRMEQVCQSENYTKAELIFWIDKIDSVNGQPFRRACVLRTFDICLNTDASQPGWGAVINLCLISLNSTHLAPAHVHGSSRLESMLRHQYLWIVFCNRDQRIIKRKRIAVNPLLFQSRYRITSKHTAKSQLCSRLHVKDDRK